ncbi:zinc ribbon domain-containing protein [Streptomyces chartreusis]|uniref:zinc ribbon domain-containing protein n=1 Tax=Streptomyces chartreusis TaxID=1969 RepID=UPI003812FC9F
MPSVFVDPAYTSQTCADCRHVDRHNRVDGGHFHLPGVRGRCPRRPERFPQHRRTRQERMEHGA